MAYVAVWMLALFLVVGVAQAQDIFFPYGAGAGDSNLPRNDDGYSEAITISTSFVFFANSYSTLYVCTNGILSFGSGISSYTPTPFPIASQPVIAPFWGDVDIRYSGEVYYREVTSAATLADLTDVIVNHFGVRGQVNSDFAATWAFITTWVNVPAYPGQGSERNTFQAVLITDGTNAFVIYNYDSITWTFGSASSGISAQVGFDAGDQTNFFALPSSRTADIANIDDQTNVGVVGRWMFRVDEAEIIDGGSEPVCNADGCDPHQTTNEDGNCEDIAPALQSCTASIDGPHVYNEITNQFEFVCDFTYTNADERSASDFNFEVEWLFNRASSPGEPVVMMVSGANSGYVQGNNVRVPISELEFRGQDHLGKWLSCAVTSYWTDSPNQRSERIISAGYWLGVRAMVQSGVDVNNVPQYELLNYIELDESDDEPQHVYLMSTLPIQGMAGQYHHWFPIYSPNTLIVHQHRGYNCSYDFYGEDWSAAERRVHHEDYPLEVRTITTITTEPMMVDFIDFRSRDSGFPYWDGYAPASITVYRYNSMDRRPEYCIASGDPRMTTFDNARYNFNARGQFVLAESTSSRGFQVHIRTFSCERATTASCVCGVVMREGDTMYEVHRCNQRRPQNIREGLIFPENDPRNDGEHNGTRWIVQKHSSGNDFVISTPSGAQVRMYWNANWGYNVYLNVIGADFDRLEGLCGTYNGNPSDDFAYRTDRWDGVDRSADPVQAESSRANEVDDFVQAWRIPRLRSWFERYPPALDEADDVTDDRTAYCACSEVDSAIPRCEQPENVNLPLPSNDIITFTGNSISISGSSTGSLQPNFGGSSNQFNINMPTGNLGGLPALGRRRRSVDDDDFDFAEDSSNGNTNSFPTPSNITHQQALEYCTAELSGDCGDVTLDQEIVDGIIDNCVQDVRDMDSMDDVAATYIGQSNYVCLSEVIRNVNVTGENMTIAEVVAEVDAILGPIVSSMCISDCSGHGSCAETVCTCYEGWLGSDCSIDESTLPSLDGFPYGDTCDSSVATCTSVIVNTHSIFQNPNLQCKVVYGEVEYIMAAILVNNMQMECDLPDVLIDTSNIIDLSISVSRDAVNFGSAATYRIYNGDCLTCVSADDECSIVTGTCSIGGNCHNTQVRNSEALCYQCQPDVIQSQWTFIDGCISSEAGVGEWGEFGDFGACDASCDYGFSHRYRSCLVADTCLHGSDTESQLCINFRCDQVRQEVNNGVQFVFEGITQSVIEQIVVSESSIRSLVATKLNSYCWTNPTECCDIASTTAQGSYDMNMFTLDHVIIVAGTLAPDTDSDTFRMRIAVEIEVETVTSACGSDVVRRDADTAYVPQSMIEVAMDDSGDDFDALNITLILVGEEVVDSGEDSEEDDETKHKGEAALIGMAAGCVLAAVVLIAIIAAVLVYKSKKNRPVAPMVGRNGEFPMTKKTNAFENPPPGYDDPDGLMYGPNHMPPLRDTRGHKLW